MDGQFRRRRRRYMQIAFMFSRRGCGRRKKGAREAGRGAVDEQFVGEVSRG